MSSSTLAVVSHILSFCSVEELYNEEWIYGYSCVRRYLVEGGDDAVIYDLCSRLIRRQFSHQSQTRLKALPLPTDSPLSTSPERVYHVPPQHLQTEQIHSPSTVFIGILGEKAPKSPSKPASIPKNPPPPPETSLSSRNKILMVQNFKLFPGP